MPPPTLNHDGTHPNAPIHHPLAHPPINPPPAHPQKWYLNFPLSESDRGKLQVTLLDPGLVGLPGMPGRHTRATRLLEFHTARACLLPLPDPQPPSRPGEG